MQWVHSHLLNLELLLWTSWRLEPCLDWTGNLCLAQHISCSSETSVKLEWGWTNCKQRSPQAFENEAKVLFNLIFLCLNCFVNLFGFALCPHSLNCTRIKRYITNLFTSHWHWTLGHRVDDYPDELDEPEIWEQELGEEHNTDIGQALGANAGLPNRFLLCWFMSSTATAHLHPQHPLLLSPTLQQTTHGDVQLKSKKASPHGWCSASTTCTGWCWLMWCGFHLSVSVLVVPYWPKSCFESLFFQLINAMVIFLCSCAEHLRLTDYLLNIQYFTKIHEWATTENFFECKLLSFSKRQPFCKQQ